MSNGGLVGFIWNCRMANEIIIIIYFICHPTVVIADESTNILLNFTMLMVLIHTHTPCVDYSPYQANKCTLDCYHVFDHLLCIQCYVIR